MSAIDYCATEVKVCCACDTWFARVKNFVDHARSCDEFAKLPEQHKQLYATLLHLKEGALQ